MDGSTGFSGTRIVVADDNAMMCRALTLMLESAGADVAASPDGFTALATIADHAPEIVFLEAMLPRLDGFQVCTVLKRNPKFRHVPVILFSAAEPLGVRARARLAGADFFLLKPLARDEIVGAVERFTARTGSPRQSGADGG